MSNHLKYSFSYIVPSYYNFQSIYSNQPIPTNFSRFKSDIYGNICSEFSESVTARLKEKEFQDPNVIGSQSVSKKKL